MYILLIGLIVFFVIVVMAVFKAFKNLFTESKNSLDIDEDVTIKCPKCGDTYTISKSMLAGGDGLLPVRCYKCNYEYKQKFHIVGE